MLSAGVIGDRKASAMVVTTRSSTAAGAATPATGSVPVAGVQPATSAAASAAAGTVKPRPSQRHLQAQRIGAAVLFHLQGARTGALVKLNGLSSRFCASKYTLTRGVNL